MMYQGTHGSAWRIRRHMWLLSVILAGVSTCFADPSVKFHRTSLINKIPIAGDIGNDVKSSVLGCARKCSTNNQCKSLFFSKDSRECQRHSILFTNESAGLTVTPSAVYFEKKDINNPLTSISQPTTTSLTTTTATTTPTTSTGAPCQPTTFACPSTIQTNFTEVILPDCSEKFSLRIFDGTLDFWQAMTKCENEGATLIQVLTVEKLAYMRQIIACPDYANEVIWIDGQYNVSIGIFETTGGIPLPMSQGDFWQPGEPSRAEPDICVWMHPEWNHFLDDNLCSYAHQISICEKY